MFNDFEFEYKGVRYKFEVEEMREEDCCKKWHELINLDKMERTMMDWSPYSNPSLEDIKLWIDLGMPSRYNMSQMHTISHDDLIRYSKDI